MDSINALNSSGIQSAESISESAKQNVLLAEQLAAQKKSEINDPLNMIGTELLTGGLGNLGKAVSKKTGIKSFEKLGSEDLSKTLRNAGREIGDKVIKKGGKIIKDKTEDFLSKGKKFAVDKINNELKSRGVDVQINEGDLDNMSNFKEILQQKVKDKLAETTQQAKDTVADTTQQVKDTLAETGQQVKDTVAETGQQVKDTVADTTQQVKDRVESQARGRDVGKGLDEEDNVTQKILGDIQEAKVPELLKNTATKNYRFADKSIENIRNTIDDLPEFSKKAKAPAKETGTLDEDLDTPQEINLFDASNKSFQSKQPSNIQKEATLDARDNIEETYESQSQKAIQQAETEANPFTKVADTLPDLKAPRISESQYLDQLPQSELDTLPTLDEFAQRDARIPETADQKILREQKERVDRSITDKANEDMGKKPSDLFSDDPNIKDPTTLTESDTASLGKTTAKVPAQVEKKVVETDLIADDDEPFTLDRDASDFVGQDKVDELAKGVDDRLSTLIGKDNDIGIRASNEIGKVKKTSDFYNNENKNPAYDPKELEDEYNQKNKILDDAEAEQKLNEPKINPNLEANIDAEPELDNDFKPIKTDDFDPTDLPPPPKDLLTPEADDYQILPQQLFNPRADQVSTLVDDDDEIRPATAADDALTGWRRQVANAQRATTNQTTPQNVNDQETEELNKEAPDVDKSVEQAQKAETPPKPSGLDEDIDDLGKADLAEGGEDIGGDLLEGILGIASLVVPSALEHDDLNSHSAVFSSSFQAGATG
tara:strand:+ start:8749 stop:11073 length:2325 start_codon:yes stop_codon:yes gene_type:complete